MVAHAHTAQLRSNLRKLVAIRFLAHLHLVSAVLVPFLAGWGKLTLAEIFFLNAWFVAWMFLLEVPTGTVADFFGRKTSLALGGVFGAMAAIVYVSVPDLGVFMVAEVLSAIAVTLHSGADEALAYDSLAELGETTRAKSVIARMQSAALSGIMLGSLLGGFVAHAWGLRAPLASHVIPSLIASMIALTLFEPARGATQKAQGYLSVLKSGMSFVRHHRIVLALGIELAVIHGLVRTIIWLYQPLIGEDGMPIAYYGFVHSAAAVGQMLLLHNVTALERVARSRRGLLIASAIVCGVGFIGLAFASHLVVTVALIVLVFTFGMTRAPLYTTYIHHYVPSENRATVMSALSMLRMLATVIVGLIVGVMADWSMTVTLVSIGIVLIVVAAVTRVEEAHLVESQVTA